MPAGSPSAADSGGSHLFEPRHLPQVFFEDMTNNLGPNSSYCIAHVRPFSSLARDLKDGKIGRYNFITPNMCDDGHDPCGGNAIAHTDTWLKKNCPSFSIPRNIKPGRWWSSSWPTKPANGDRTDPVPGPRRGVKKGFKNEIYYNHSSLLRTLEEFFKVSPMSEEQPALPDLRDLFSALP